MIGIVILNYNSWEDSKGCIESICKDRPGAPFRIYLVDNASPVRPSEAVMDYCKRQQVVLLEAKENRGYAAGNNIGIAEAMKDSCDAILISNSDVRFYPHSIDNMYQCLQQDPRIGIVGPKIHLPNGRTQRECMMMRTGMREKYMLRTRLHVLAPANNERYWGRQHDYERETFFVYAVLGCCFMIKGECAKEVMLVDEHTFLYEEELILGIRMAEKKWSTIYYPKSEILHKHEATTGGIGRNQFAYTCQVCSEIYYCRHYLQADKREILPLYGYRTLLYLCRCLWNPAFRRKWGEYVERTRKELG